MARRTDAEIEAVTRLNNQTHETAMEIEADVNADLENDDNYIRIRGAYIGGLKAKFQREAADLIVVEFSTKDPATARKVGDAIRKALEG